MNVREIKARLHLQECSKLTDARQSSGLSIKEWCQQNDVPETKYYYYLKKLRLAACEGFPEMPSTNGMSRIKHSLNRISLPTQPFPPRKG